MGIGYSFPAITRTTRNKRRVTAERRLETITACERSLYAAIWYSAEAKKFCGHTALPLTTEAMQPPLPWFMSWFIPAKPNTPTATKPISNASARYFTETEYHIGALFTIFVSAKAPRFRRRQRLRWT